LENLSLNKNTPLAILIKLSTSYNTDFSYIHGSARKIFEKRTGLTWEEYKRRLILKRLTPLRRKYFKELGITKVGKPKKKKSCRGKGRI